MQAIIDAKMAADPKAGASLRLTLCCHRRSASCRRITLCEALVKSPGGWAAIYCVASGQPVSLVTALHDPAWHCPRGAF